MKSQPRIRTKAGKRRMIRELHKSMLKSFLADINKIPPGWDGIEIKTWMAERWARETQAGAMRNQRGGAQPYTAYRNTCYNRGL